eukprot:CAMPEP_0171779244 /NCGR_PEP_ID=MMETSP0991-20121206/58896_1 /TAXON_ID=483369 /ORGANISM="non described non described, Strain CCMP2098" /LENGTH=126 /DNA_ID=CAMNT_0012386381 /DNA_START=107 /DNA_END=487 /DNA_ORIENTATION=+
MTFEPSLLNDLRGGPSAAMTAASAGPACMLSASVLASPPEESSGQKSSGGLMAWRCGASAPASRRNASVSLSRFSTAIDMGVFRFAFLQSTLAPHSIKILTMEALHSFAASCKGVVSFARAFGSAP